MDKARLRALTHPVPVMFFRDVNVEMDKARLRALTPLQTGIPDSLDSSVEMDKARLRALTHTFLVHRCFGM